MKIHPTITILCVSALAFLSPLFFLNKTADACITASTGLYVFPTSFSASSLAPLPPDGSLVFGATLVGANFEDAPSYLKLRITTADGASVVDGSLAAYAGTAGIPASVSQSGGEQLVIFAWTPDEPLQAGRTYAGHLDVIEPAESFDFELQVSADVLPELSVPALYSN